MTVDTWLYVVSPWVSVAAICFLCCAAQPKPVIRHNITLRRRGSYVDEIKRDICLTQVFLHEIVALQTSS